MNNLRTNREYLLLIITAFILSIGLITPDHFPYFGFTVSLGLISSLVYFFKPEKSRFTQLLYILSLIFASFITIRANELMTFLNIVASVTSISLMAMIKDETHHRFLSTFFAPLQLFIQTLATPNRISFNFDTNKLKTTFSQENQLSNKIQSFGLAILVLLIIIPLLSSVNPIFKNLVDDVLHFINWQWLSDLLHIQLSELIIPRIIFFTLLVATLPRLVTYLKENKKHAPHFFQHSLSLIPAKLIVSIVLVIFFITQIQLYFASEVSLAALGYTNSQQTREVFAQLTLVSLVIISLIYNNKDQRSLSKRLTILLVIEGLFLTAIAFKSVFDYSYLFGFTHKRLWGFSGIAWITGIFGLYLYSFFKKLTADFFVKGVIIISSITLIMVNLLNFDYLIYQVRQPNLGQDNPDFYYLSYQISTDAMQYPDLMEKLQAEYLKDPQINSFNFYLHNRQVQKINRLKDKYDDISLWNFNLYEYRQFVKVKDLTLSEIPNEQ